jgi:hypothetical protein
LRFWALLPKLLSVAVLTPITSPRMLKSGPPELPGEIGAENWIHALLL